MKRTHSFWWAVILGLIMCLLAASTWSPVQAGDNGGTALDFDGDDQVVITETSSVQHLGASGLTLEAWIYPVSVEGSRGSIIRNNHDYNLVLVNGHLSGRVEPDGDNGDGLYHNQTTTSTIATNVWTHVAAVSDTTGIRLYVNGSLVPSSMAEAIYYGLPEQLWLGRDEQWQSGFDGTIDEVRIWNTPRTQAQIQSTMFQEISGTPSGLVGYWRFDEGSGLFTADGSGQGNDGTLANTPNDPAWVTSTAPLGNLNAAYQNGMAGMWGGVPNTASDEITTGLDIANVSFLNDTGDDIVFGHNGLSFNCCVTDNLATTPNAQKRWVRLWELDVSDQAGTIGGTVDLTFDISDAGGSGSFSTGGNYYLLQRPVGSTADFTETAVINTIISADQVTFRVAVADLGSEFTLGADQASPTALETIALMAHPSAGGSTALAAGVLLIALGAAFGYVYQARRRLM